MGAIPLRCAPPQVPSAQAHAAKGKELLTQGDLPSAERELRQAVEMAPQEAEFLALLGVALGMLSKARATLAAEEPRSSC
jgi:Flp pilus assembly protein TadD